MRWMRSPPTNPLFCNCYYCTVILFYQHRMSAFHSIISSFRFLLLALLLGSGVAQAQPGGGGRRAERLGQLENAKIAFLTSRLSLTQEQAQKFWPLYNEFTAKRREFARSARQLRLANPAALSDQQVRDNINQSFALRQQELNLEKEYFDRFQKVLAVRQVGQLIQAEKDFTKEVLKRVADRRGGGSRLSTNEDD